MARLAFYIYTYLPIGLCLFSSCQEEVPHDLVECVFCMTNECQTYTNYVALYNFVELSIRINFQ